MKEKQREKPCRVCLGIGIMSSIFEVEDNYMISFKIMSLAKVRIYPGDGLPDTICRTCISRLNSCNEFISLCQVSDLKLRSAATESDEIEIISQTVVNNDVPTGSDNDIKCSQKIKSLEDLQLNSSDESTSSVPASEVIGYISNDCNAKSQEEKEVITSKVNKTQQQCNICGRVMSSRHRLKTHLVTHTNERPYSCPHCKKSFSLTANLKVHLRVHTGEKPFQCSVCGKSFAQTSGLITHKRKHTGQAPYKCLLCSRSFRTIGHLHYHTKRHTGEKKFECDQCDRAFITRGDLNQHLATHFSDRHHVCSICGMRLTRASNLRRHMQQLHSSSPNIEIK